MSNGVQIRLIAEHASTYHEVGRLVVYVWPLPYSALPGLGAHVQQSVNAYLTEQKIVSGEMTYLTTQGKAH